MASKKWTFDQALLYFQDGTLDLNSNTLKAALVTSSQVSTYDAWATGTSYDVGDIVVPTTTANGRRYICTVAGDSHATTEPTWPTTEEGTVTDNEVTWQEYGGDLCNLTTWAQISANEVATGDGYTTGGEALANLALSLVNQVVSGVTKRGVKWDADNVTWTALTKTFRYLVVYASGSLNGTTDPLLFYVLLDDTPADVAVSGVDFSINWHADGLHVLYM